MTPTAAEVIERLGLERDRPLAEPELVRVVAAIGEQRALWAPHAPSGCATRTYAELHRDERMDVWAIFWVPGGDTGWHDHDTSSGAVHVVDGALEEHVLRIGAEDGCTTHPAGASFSFGPSHIHRMTCSLPAAVSIHAYSPALWRLGQYTVEPDGTLQRVSVSYADELRPLEAAA